MSEAPKSRLSPELIAARRLRAEAGGAVAIFAGAGASVPFGYPLTGMLLRRIIEWQDDEDFLCLGMDQDKRAGEKRRSLP
ncbi:MAG: hypothetical protein HY699_22525 [Deltaproteobacteria bacterium]|nr:hypothetical protein [Deltaproteobacteria bacterium]